VKIPGHFRSLAGSLKITPDGATGVLEIDAASLDTRNRLRDRHLRSPDFFAVAEHPQLRYELHSRPGWAREAPARGSAHGRWRPDRVAARR
jgi:polyisoprenoid-binding protein YceI